MWFCGVDGTINFLSTNSRSWCGAVMPIATTIVGDIYSTEERAKIQGYLSSVWGISAVSGPVIGGTIVQYISWKYVFWVNVPLGIIAMVGIAFFLT